MARDGVFTGKWILAQNLSCNTGARDASSEPMRQTVTEDNLPTRASKAVWELELAAPLIMLLIFEHLK